MMREKEGARKFQPPSHHPGASCPFSVPALGSDECTNEKSRHSGTPYGVPSVSAYRIACRPLPSCDLSSLPTSSKIKPNSLFSGQYQICDSRKHFLALAGGTTAQPAPKGSSWTDPGRDGCVNEHEPCAGTKKHGVGKRRGVRLPPRNATSLPEPKFSRGHMGAIDPIK